jgi:Phytochelatin synthase
MGRILVLGIFALFVTVAQAQEAPKPKFGPEAVPIFDMIDYLQDADAPDYWTLSAFYLPQQTSSDCSAAAVTMAVNALRGLPSKADEEIVTEKALLEEVADTKWSEQVADKGPGVTFDDLTRVLRESLDANDLDDASIEAVQPKAADAGALAKLKTALAANEESEDDVMLVYFNQGVITGDWDGPHISPIGAYDAANDRVLVMDVDRTWYVPYWTSTKTLLAALVKPISAEHGVLAGGTGGYIVVDNE